jgi:hypothetical protein
MIHQVKQITQLTALFLYSRVISTSNLKWLKHKFASIFSAPPQEKGGTKTLGVPMSGRFSIIMLLLILKEMTLTENDNTLMTCLDS